MNNKGNLIIISGPSGSGKDTVLNSVFKNHKNIEFSISYATRPMRKGETQDLKYHHISKNEFLHLIKNNEFLEYNEYQGNLYGTAKKPVLDALNSGKDMIIEVDVNGAANIRKAMPEAISVFILPPSFEILKKRLTNRGTETTEEINGRLNAALEEIKRCNEYTYIIFNDDLDLAVKEFESILISERLKYKNNKEIIERLF